MRSASSSVRLHAVAVFVSDSIDDRGRIFRMTDLPIERLEEIMAKKVSRMHGSKLLDCHA
jgi:hypothetical protein